MTVADILKLIDAGYTKEQIEEMGSEKQEVSNNDSKQCEKGEADHDGEKTEGEDLSKTVEDLKKQNKNLSDTIKQMQADNARTAKQEKKEPMTAESAIKSFIEMM